MGIKKFKKIAIVKLSAMGDIIHAGVVLYFIKRSFPNSSIDWVIEEDFAPLLKNSPDIDNVYSVSIKRFKKTKSLSLLFENIKMLKSLGNYDYIIDMQGLFKSAIVARLIGKNVYGFDKNSTRESMAAMFYKNSFDIPYDMNVIERGVKLVENTLNISISKKDILYKKPFLFGNKVPQDFVDNKVVVIVGASWKSKIYPANLMADVIINLNKEVYLIYGNKEEEEIATRICSLTALAKKIKKLSISELIEFIKKASLVIGADTGPTHIAWALNVPSITIFGPTPSFRNVMSSDINKTIDAGKKIDPSNLDKNNFCINTISPMDIANIAKSLL